MRTTIAALAAILAVLPALPAQAGLYRCGNAYQDRPCDDGAQQKVMRRGGQPERPAVAKPTAAASAAASAPQSTKR